ncbi:alkaline phosphatase family protein [Halocatena halophila]|uniref:hypothetical protein n=1 Tax=Halocatena halophila TaxID=2814576 RepID=UPI002ED4115A
MLGSGRYTLDNLIDAARNPKIFLGEFHRLGFEVNRSIHRRMGDSKGDPVTEEDWDVLHILDACRLDMFRDQNTIDGELESRYSLGSESWEFLNKNFAGDTFHDTVYVTANPHAPSLPEDTFHATINLLESDWDTVLQTVHPEDVTKAALKANKKFPDKRLIIHFMQPHYPFIGEFGQQLDHKGYDNPNDESKDDSTPREVWGSLGHGRISKDDVWRAYRENLDVVLPHVQQLVDEITGKAVVTADHGNLVGERTSPLPVRGYGHPRGAIAPELREVPWLIVEDGARRTISNDPPVETDRMQDDLVEDRLAALGYR